MVRPREFDEQQVIGQALDVFWNNGLDATSLDMLEENTGLKRSSLYAAFGSKLNLFCLALDAYSAGPCVELALPFKEQNGSAALIGYLNNIQAFLSSEHAQKGCLMVNSGFEGIDSQEINQRIEQHFQMLKSQMKLAFQQSINQNEIDKSFSADEAASWLLVCVRGILVGAASGEDVDELKHAIDVTISKLNFKA